MLFDRSGGKITKEMAQIIADVEIHDKFADMLVNNLRKMWDEWNLQVRDYSKSNNSIHFGKKCRHSYNRTKIISVGVHTLL